GGGGRGPLPRRALHAYRHPLHARERGEAIPDDVRVRIDRTPRDRPPGRRSGDRTLVRESERAQFGGYTAHGTRVAFVVVASTSEGSCLSAAWECGRSCSSS